MLLPIYNSYAELDSAQTTDTSQQVVTTSVQQVGRASTSLNKWQKPQLGRIKCNIDASLWNCTGIGICLCYEDSEYVLAKTMSLSPMHTVEVEEALELFYTLRWLIDKQFGTVDFVVVSNITSDAFNINRQM